MLADDVGAGRRQRRWGERTARIAKVRPSARNAYAPPAGPARCAAAFIASQRQRVGAAVAIAGVVACIASVATAQAADPRVAIIDTAWDTRPYIPALRGAGVEVVGRYLARCPQPERGLTQKRLIDQGGIRDAGSEVRRLLDADMAILSIYQYNNDSENKFSGRDRNGLPLPGADCRPSATARGAAEEARLDALAATRQAKALGQPRGSAIYFGVDIAFDARDTALRAAVLDYFRTVRRVLRRARYEVGAYGNGDVLALLQEADLIDHAWLSASRAYRGSTELHNAGRWQLFQHGVNLEWFTGRPGACRPGLPLDVNLKNPAFARRDLGFWTRRKTFRLPPRRTRAIFATRRFACDGVAVIRRTAQSGPSDSIAGAPRCAGGRQMGHPTTIDYANAVRIGERSGDLVAVDYDDDGAFDGWTAVSNLTADFATKPYWVFDRDARRGARCP